jgi:hypothetical protein
MLRRAATPPRASSIAISGHFLPMAAIQLKFLAATGLDRLLCRQWSQRPLLCLVEHRARQRGQRPDQLALNRASPLLDIDSYLPYEGKVIVAQDRAKDLGSRPAVVDKKAIRSRIGGQPGSPYWLGNYFVFDQLKPSNVLTPLFPSWKRPNCTP